MPISSECEGVLPVRTRVDDARTDPLPCVLLVEEDPELGAALSARLHRAGILHQVARSVEESLTGTICIGKTSQVVLLGVDVAAWSSHDRVAQALAAAGERAVVVIDHGNSDPASVLAEFSGVHDVIPAGQLSGTVLQQAIRLAALRRNLHLDELADARTDPVTGLANRAEVNLAVDRAIDAVRGGSQRSLLFVDLDRFKQVNDGHGHPAGDRLLAEVAARICESIDDGFAGRFGGDEFVVVMAGDEGEAADTAERVLRDLRRPFDLAGEVLTVSASVGVCAIRPEDSRQSLFHNTDVALLRAKHLGRSRVEVFDAALRGWQSRQDETASTLRASLANGGLRLAQGIITSPRHGRLLGVAVRPEWSDAGAAFDEPIERVAARCGMGASLGLWTLEAACRLLAEHPAQAPLVEVRLPRHLLARQGIAERVASILHRFRVEPDRLRLVIDEDDVLAVEGSEVVLASFQGIGVRLGLICFGRQVGSLRLLEGGRFDVVRPVSTLLEGVAVESPRARFVEGIVAAAAAYGTAAGAVLHCDLMLEPVGRNAIAATANAECFPGSDAERAVLTALGIAEALFWADDGSSSRRLWQTGDEVAGRHPSARHP